MEAIIVKILRLESTMSRDIGSESREEACVKLEALPVESHIGLTAPRPMYNNMHMEYCQARKLTRALVSRISIRAWLLKHGRQSVG